MKIKYVNASFLLACLVGSILTVGCLGNQEAGTNATDATELRLKGDSQDSAAKAKDTTRTPKVSICHIPPGNPANAHTLVIGAPAVQAHLAHGDTLGECLPQPPVCDSCGAPSDSTIDTGS